MRYRLNLNSYCNNCYHVIETRKKKQDGSANIFQTFYWAHFFSRCSKTCGMARKRVQENTSNPHVRSLNTIGMLEKLSFLRAKQPSKHTSRIKLNVELNVETVYKRAYHNMGEICVQQSNEDRQRVCGSLNFNARTVYSNGKYFACLLVDCLECITTCLLLRISLLLSLSPSRTLPHRRTLLVMLRRF